MSWQFQYIWLLSALLLVSCKDQQAPTQSSSLSTLVDVTQAKALIEAQSVTLIDVRTPAETKEGMIEGAIEIDYRAGGFRENLNKLDKNKAYLVYCKSGGRSAKTQKMMNELGFLKVYDLDGGYTAWSKK